MNARRVLERINTLAGPDFEAEGVQRLVFSDAHLQAREQVIKWGKEAGLSPSVDAVGNLWLLPPHPDAPLLLLGSHTDSVPSGGKFDGTLGVVAALELVQSYQERGEPHHIAVVDFLAEESSRFGVGTIGSSVFAGHRRLEEVNMLRDQHEESFADCRKGLWADLEQAAPDQEMFSSYLEIHVDQARELLEHDLPLAIVRAIAAPTRWKITVEGVQSHAGSSGMHSRRDALAAAAEVVLLVEEHALRLPEDSARATVGFLAAYPNAVNVVAGHAELIIDLRALSKDVVERFRRWLRADLTFVERRGVSVKMDELMSDAPALMNAPLIALLQASCRELDLPEALLDSWPAHDAMHVGSVLPAGMMLVRNVGGVSHNPKEEATLGDIDAALRVLSVTATELIHDQAKGRPTMV